MTKQRQKEALVAKAAKYFPFGYEPATGTSFVVEDAEDYVIIRKTDLTVLMVMGTRHSGSGMLVNGGRMRKISIQKSFKGRRRDSTRFIAIVKNELWTRKS